MYAKKLENLKQKAKDKKKREKRESTGPTG